MNAPQVRGTLVQALGGRRRRPALLTSAFWAEVGWSRGVWIAALVAVVARIPSALWPLRPDEAGFLLVARAWDPSADSVYGPYFVDRPPPIIAFFKLTDAIGGAYFHRVVGAVAVGLLVLALAAAADELVRLTGLDDTAARKRVTRWTAIISAALVSNTMIDAAAVKGEILGITLISGSCWLTLRAVRLSSHRAAFASGLLAMSAVGMKQNLVSGLIFGAVVLIGCGIVGRLTWPAIARFAAAATLGAAVPIAAVIGWALWAGVDLSTLWYTTVSFRGEANLILSAQESKGAADRVRVLAWAWVLTGLAAVLAWLLIRLRPLARIAPVVTSAVVITLVVDTILMIMSGSYWLPYLYALIPGSGMAVAVLMAMVARRPRASVAKSIVSGIVIVSSVLAFIGWGINWAFGAMPREYVTGNAIAEVAGQSDTLMVYGGRADIQFYSGLRSPYTHLWSLPMRTMDPKLDELEDLLTGADSPTWVVIAARVDVWSEVGTRPIERALLRRYDYVTTSCKAYRIYHVNTTDPVDLDVDCDGSWRRWAPPAP